MDRVAGFEPVGPIGICFLNATRFKRIAELTEGKTLTANHKLVVGNAKLAALVAVCFAA